MEAKEVDSRMIMRARNVLCLVMALMMAVSVCLAEETPSLKDDFYAVVNAEWLEQTEIPSDAPEVSVFSELGDQVQEVLKADFQAMLDGEKAVPEELTDFIELYRLAADYETRDALGAEDRSAGRYGRAAGKPGRPDDGGHASALWRDSDGGYGRCLRQRAVYGALRALPVG